MIFSRVLRAHAPPNGTNANSPLCVSGGLVHLDFMKVILIFMKVMHLDFMKVILKTEACEMQLTSSR